MTSVVIMWSTIPYQRKNGTITAQERPKNGPRTAQERHKNGQERPRRTLYSYSNNNIYYQHCKVIF